MAERADKPNNRLSASDMSSLLAERGAVHVNVGGTIIVGGRAPDFDLLLAHIERRLDLLPRYRQRITEIPLGIKNPVWGDDPEFELRRHVLRTGLPSPGSDAELRELVGRVMSEPLDMRHPLWKLYLVDGLSGGRHALISKSHHALVDGVSAVDVGTVLLDVTPEVAEIPAKGRWSPSALSRGELLGGAAAEWVTQPLEALGRGVRSAVTTPVRTAKRVTRTAEAATSLAAGGPKCPPSFLNVEIGCDRLVGWMRTDLAQLKAARGDSGATVNDVILAVAAGGLRRRFKARRIKLPEYLIALVPVSIRRPGEEDSLGNRISTIFVRLPIRERNPRKRLRLIREETVRLKNSPAVDAASLMIQATGWTPPTVNKLISGAMSRPLVFNLVVSNVPGPQQPLYLLGRKLREIYPYVPLSPQEHALSVGAISYDGGLYFGLVGDFDAMYDVERLAADMKEALAEQLAAAKPRAKRRAPAKRKPAAKDKPKRGPGSKRTRRRMARGG
ncbi:MAG: wax ester/triacylglycerol synthase family O-acyltransferase [Solirubrobacterales bacterium]|nr:wax ester/triacylglycerol synthase family O-acyltransferase [Solirubrobacterales bacterium]